MVAMSYTLVSRYDIIVFKIPQIFLIILHKNYAFIKKKPVLIKYTITIKGL